MQKKIYIFDDFLLDINEHLLLKNNNKITLRPKTFQLLKYFVENSQRLLTKEELFEKVWQGTIVSDSALSQIIKELRKALEDDAANPHYIKTVHSIGFTFISEVTLKQFFEDSVPKKLNSSTKAEIEKTSLLKKLTQNRKPIVVFFFVLAIIIVILYSVNNIKADIPFKERDWVLLVNSIDQNDTEEINKTIVYALRWELQRSAFVNIVPAGRITDVLALMKMNPDTIINIDIARQISIRDGNIKLIFSGKMELINKIYNISVNIIDPVSGSVIYTTTEECNSKEEIFPAVRLLALDLRKALGESIKSISISEKKLEKVTTPSLKALEYFSTGWDYLNQFKWQSSKIMFERAKEEDSTFAMSYEGLGFTFLWLGNTDAASHNFEKAYKLRFNLTDRERYFIEGSYFAYGLGNYQKAIPLYEILVNLYPDDYWGHENLSMYYEFRGDFDKSITHKKEAQRIRPNYAVNYQDLGVLALLSENNFEKAYRELEKARELNPDYPIEFVQLLDFFYYWMNDNFTLAEKELDKFFEYKNKKLLPAFRLTTNWFIARYYNYIGNFREANILLNENIQKASSNNFSNYLYWTELELAINFRELNNIKEAEKLLNKIILNSQGCVRIEALGWLAFIKVGQGKITETYGLLKQMKEENRPMPYDVIHPHLPNELVKIKKSFTHLINGEALKNKGNFKSAIKEFEKVLNTVPPNQVPVMTASKPIIHLVALNSLAELYDSLNERDKSIEFYNRILKLKTFNITQYGASIIWRRALRSLYNLAKSEHNDSLVQEIEKKYFQLLQ